jgi:two-component system KDP operon response regulator KdpE
MLLLLLIDMNAVIIEDEKDLGILMRNFLLSQFKANGSNALVHVATSLTEGLKFIEELNPEWIFVDNNLPDGKGINEISSIKRNKKTSKTCVVMMSAMTNLREEAIKKGADYFLDKPISFVEIEKILVERA